MTAEALTAEYAASLLPLRDESGDKACFGNALVVAGSSRFTGAPYFSAQACQRCGTGLVRLAVPSSIHTIEASKLNEVMVIALADDFGVMSERAVEDVIHLAAKSTAVLIGPGLSIAEGPQKAVRALLEECRVPLVLDADALNCLAGEKKPFLSKRCDVVITPHRREFERLFAKCGELTDDRLAQLAKDNDVTIVSKGSETRIASSDGRVLACCGFRNSGMAKGGSGDVLAGMVLAFLSQGLRPFDAASLAVRLHCEAGMAARQSLGEFCMLPSDVISFLPQAFRRISHA